MSDLAETTAPAPDAAKAGVPPGSPKVIDIGGRVVWITREADGAIVLTPSGRITPFRFDRYQAGALRDVLGAVTDDNAGYVFQRGLGRIIPGETLTLERFPKWGWWLGAQLGAVVLLLLAAAAFAAAGMGWLA